MMCIYLRSGCLHQRCSLVLSCFEAQPAFGVVRCYGEEMVLQEGSEQLAALTMLVNKQISGDKRWDELNLTNETFSYFQTSDQMMVLELHYDQPQRIHSFSPFFSNFDTLLMPLDGRHAEKNIIFSLVTGNPSGGCLPFGNDCACACLY